MWNTITVAGAVAGLAKIAKQLENVALAKHEESLRLTSELHLAQTEKERAQRISTKLNELLQ